MRDLETIKNIHFIGIGGISMSALAKLMLIKGKKVSGSDSNFTETITSLTELGANVYVGSQIDIVRKSELVVYSGAIREDDEELSFAKYNAIPTVSRSKFLSMTAQTFSKVISISGTHGKTTTTAMLSNIFLKADRFFTSHIGGDCVGIGNMIYKGEEFFITEACEYQKAFLELKSNYSVILNVEKDHPDTYSTYFDVLEAFTKFADNTKDNGKVFYSLDNCNLPTKKPTLTFGLKKGNDFRAVNIHEHKNGYYGYQIEEYGVLKSNIELNIPGYHNIYNSLACYAVARESGIEIDRIEKGVASFSGVKRRFEYRGETNGAKIYLDYAHHPSEIFASIKTAQSLRPKAIKVVFQPHTFSRTKELFYDFLESFNGIDTLYLIPTYKAREEERNGLNSYDLYLAADKEKIKTYYYANLLSLSKELTLSLEKEEILLILGAGNVNMLADLIVDYK